MAIEYKQFANLFTFNANHCLQNDFYHNYCDICTNLCPEDAFSLIRNKLILDETLCTNCSACIGSCPTEALSVSSFNENKFTQEFEFNEIKTLNCKDNTPCLNIFDHYHFTSMAIHREFTCDLSHCDECSINKNSIVKNDIKRKIEDSNDFLGIIGLDNKINIKNEVEIEKESKQKFRFKPLFQDGENIKKRSIIETKNLSTLRGIKERLPLKNRIFKDTIKTKLETLEKTKFDTKTPLITYKNIRFESCTLCGDCIQFCPTEAFFSSTDKQAIFFTPNKCIDCNICHGICKPMAIERVSDGFDLVDIAYDRSQELVRYEMALCLECKCAYPYKGGEQICERCIEFKDDMDDMMVMAKDM